MRRRLMMLDRREAVAAIAGAGSLVLLNCNRGPQGNLANAVAVTPQAASMTVYKDPNCGCCSAWARIARDAGYRVTLVDRTDMAAVKARLGVPEALASCHTTVVGGYAVEGHVPMEAIARLLADKPGTIRGIAVPGMPRGSPGMETPDGSSDAFDVIAFDSAGQTRIFRG